MLDLVVLQVSQQRRNDRSFCQSTRTGVGLGTNLVADHRSGGRSPHRRLLMLLFGQEPTPFHPPKVSYFLAFGYLEYPNHSPYRTIRLIDRLIGMTLRERSYLQLYTLVQSFRSISSSNGSCNMRLGHYCCRPRKCIWSERGHFWSFCSTWQWKTTVRVVIAVYQKFNSCL